jgi:hypothetical protein
MLLLLGLSGKNVNPTDQNPPTQNRITRNPPTQNHTPQKTATQSPTPQVQVPPLSTDTEGNENPPGGDADEVVDGVNDDPTANDDPTEIESAATIPSQPPPVSVTAPPGQTSQPEKVPETASNTDNVKIPLSRTWVSGKFTVEAELVDISKDGKTVKLRRDDNGKVVDVPVEKLSQKDQDYVEMTRWWFGGFSDFDVGF